MKTAEMGVLEQVAVQALIASSYQENLGDVDGRLGLADERQALTRLEDLGLIAYGPATRGCRKIVVTRAGVEALAYLATAV